MIINFEGVEVVSNERPTGIFRRLLPGWKPGISKIHMGGSERGLDEEEISENRYHGLL